MIPPFRQVGAQLAEREESYEIILIADISRIAGVWERGRCGRSGSNAGTIRRENKSKQRAGLWRADSRGFCTNYRSIESNKRTRVSDCSDHHRDGSKGRFAHAG